MRNIRQAIREQIFVQQTYRPCYPSCHYHLKNGQYSYREVTMQFNLIEKISDPTRSGKTNIRHFIQSSCLAVFLTVTLAVFSAPTYAHQGYGHGKPLLYYGLVHHFNHGYRYNKRHHGYRQKNKRYGSYGYRQRHYGNYRNQGHRGDRYSDRRRYSYRNNRGIDHGRFRRH